MKLPKATVGTTRRVLTVTGGEIILPVTQREVVFDHTADFPPVLRDYSGQTVICERFIDPPPIGPPPSELGTATPPTSAADATF